MKKVLLLLFAIILIVGGYYGYQEYQERKFIETIAPNVKNVSLRLTNASKH